MLTPLSVVGISRYHRPETGWTKRRQEFDRNPHLSLRAFRVASYVLSHAEGFVQTERQIGRGCGISVNTVRAAVADLVEAGYVVKRRIREHGRWVGTAYAVSDQPFTPEEVAQLLPPGAESERTESVRRESASPKKTTPARETITSREDQPSGGSPADAVDAEPGPDDRHKEDHVPRGEPLTLFDAPPVPAAEPERRGEKSAKDVVAAYVDSHRRHIGGEPLRRDIGRVARDAKAMLTTGEATMAELLAAANELGNTTFANLGQQVKMLRRRLNPDITKGSCPPVSKDDPVWAQQRAAEQAAMDRDLAEDPEFAAMMAEMRAKYTQGAA